MRAYATHPARVATQQRETGHVDTARERPTSTLVALRLGLSRERVIRKIQLGEISGRVVAGKWIANEASVRRLEQQQQRRRESESPRAA